MPIFIEGGNREIFLFLVGVTKRDQELVLKERQFIEKIKKIFIEIYLYSHKFALLALSLDRFCHAEATSWLVDSNIKRYDT